jgi:hypothetical protein
MKSDYKQKLFSGITLPKYHVELRIGEGLLVFFLLIVLMLVLI